MLPTRTRAFSRRLLALVAAFAALGAELGAEDDPDALWRVAIAAFSVGEDGDATLLKAAEIVPALLLASLSDLPEHRYSIEAATARAARLAVASRVAADKALAEARSRLDRLALSGTTGTAERKRLEEAYRQALANAEAVAEDEAEVAVPPAKPIAFHAENATGTPLLLKVPPAELATVQKLDMVVSGSIRRVGGYLAVSLEAWDRDLGAPVAEIVDYSAPDDLESLVTRVLPVLREALAGGSVRRVEISTDPPDALVSVFDESGAERPLLQSERVVYLYGDSERTLVARAPGRETLTVALAGSGADERLDLALVPLPQGPALTLDSMPTGATLYMEGRKLGRAPLEVDPVPYPRVAEFRLEGFRPATFVLEPGQAEAPKPLLVPEAEALPASMETRRDEFYESLGWFVASLPVSVLSWQVYRSYYDAALLAGGSDPAAYDSLAAAAGASGAAFAASAGVSVGLAGFSAFRLWRYIRSAD